MKFGPVDIDDAEQAVLVHSLRFGQDVLKKGHVLNAADVARLKAAGVAQVMSARMEADDVTEDEAARLMAQVVGGVHIRIDPAFTGRANMFATCDGVLAIDADVINAINALDERLTIATLPLFRPVVEGEMVATVKIIPFAIPQTLVEAARRCAKADAIRILPYHALRVGVISTVLPSLQTSTIEKTLAALQQRLAAAKAPLVRDVRVAHETVALQDALTHMQGQVDLVIVFGASAITDRRDIIPAALEMVGGRIEQLGMPVDPGNLLLLGRLKSDIPVIGAPGCARSPVENGFDWVLQRLLVGLPVQAQDMRAMGVGGLLMEIISRPQPRAGGNAHDDH